jgi:Ca2+/Na+ antiporter
MSFAQLMWAFTSYGYVLFVSSNMISDGSELLLLIPSIAGMVGSIVLPILGAVPDGMMVLFSGMDPDVHKAQQQVAVGVGALAGSTIMLLTLPWVLAVAAGRVDLDDNGECMYRRTDGQPKLSGEKNALKDTGVKFGPAIKKNAKFMIGSSMIYLVILIPALSVDKMDAKLPFADEAKYEHFFSLIGLFLAVMLFGYYLYLQYAAAKAEEGNEKVELKVSNMVGNIQEYGLNFYIEEFRQMQKNTPPRGDAEEPLTSGNGIPANMKSALKNIFYKYAREDGQIDRNEFEDLFRDLHVEPEREKLNQMFNAVDTNKSDFIEYNEFLNCFKMLVDDESIRLGSLERQESKKSRLTEAKKKEAGAADDDEEEEEEEDLPEEWANLSPEEQKKKILMRACRLMGIGTLLVLIFSDPMVDVLSGIGQHTGISAFYISFVLAPLASNASELVAAYSYAQKKTSKTITISMSTLEGAACMNNTFCVAIFFALIYVQGLAWRFTAETIVIVGVQVVVGVIAMMKETQTLMMAIIILSLYPASLVFVSLLEEFGLD